MVHGGHSSAFVVGIRAYFSNASSDLWGARGLNHQSRVTILIIRVVCFSMNTYKRVSFAILVIRVVCYTMNTYNKEPPL